MEKHERDRKRDGREIGREKGNGERDKERNWGEELRKKLTKIRVRDYLAKQYPLFNYLHFQEKKNKNNGKEVRARVLGIEEGDEV